MTFFEKFWKAAEQGGWMSVWTDFSCRLALFLSMHSDEEGFFPVDWRKREIPGLSETGKDNGERELACFGILVFDNLKNRPCLEIPDRLSIDERRLLSARVRDALVKLYWYDGHPRCKKVNPDDFAEGKGLSGKLEWEKVKDFQLRRAEGEEVASDWRSILGMVKADREERVVVPDERKSKMFPPTQLEAIRSYEKLTGNLVVWSEVELFRKAFKTVTPRALINGITKVINDSPRARHETFTYFYPIVINHAFGERKPRQENAQKSNSAKAGGIVGGSRDAWAERFGRLTS